MASLDSLPADQKAVLSLVLQRGRTFDEIAALLSIDRAAVRQRALEGFDALGPDTTLEPLKRALITDYLLGQLPEAVASTVRAGLAGNPPERAWARVVAAELAPLAVNGLPEIPSAAGKGKRPQAPAPTPEPEDAFEPDGEFEPEAVVAAPARRNRRDAPAREAAPAAAAAGATTPTATGPASSRRGGAILLGVIAAVIVLVVVILLATGGSSKKKHSPTASVAQTGTTTTGGAATTGDTGTGSSTTAVPLHQITMTSPTSVKGRQGAADVVRAAGKLGVVLVAEGLTANTTNAYGVWLYDSKSGTSKFLGFYSQKVAGTGKTKGELEAEVELPTGATAYNELLLTLETAEKPTKPGPIVLEGVFAE